MKSRLLGVVLLFTSSAFAGRIDSTGTVVHHIRKKDMTRLPAYGSLKLAGLQTGAVDKRDFLHICGGRSDEIALYIDGILQRHPITGDPLFDLATTATDQVAVTTSGFSAEYGAAMSGVIQVINPRDKPSLTGAAEGITDRYTKPSFGHDALSLSRCAPSPPSTTSSMPFDL